MAWCEENRVDYLFGLARTSRLVEHIHIELAWAEHDAEATGRPARRFADFRWTTRESWSRRRRAVAKAEWMPGRGAKGANPRFVVTSLKADRADARTLYEQIYCARGEMENRIKECQLDLFADRTSAATMRANQLRLWFASMAYVLVTAHRPRRHRVRRRHLRQHPPEAPEDRRPGHPQRPPRPCRHGLELPRRRRLPPRPRPIMRLIHTRPAQPAAPPTNPDFDRAEAQRTAAPDRPPPSSRGGMIQSVLTFTKRPVRNAG